MKTAAAQSAIVWRAAPFSPSLSLSPRSPGSISRRRRVVSFEPVSDVRTARDARDLRDAVSAREHCGDSGSGSAASEAVHVETTPSTPPAFFRSPAAGLLAVSSSTSPHAQRNLWGGEAGEEQDGEGGEDGQDAGAACVSENTASLTPSHQHATAEMPARVHGQEPEPVPDRAVCVGRVDRARSDKQRRVCAYDGEGVMTAYALQAATATEFERGRLLRAVRKGEPWPPQIAEAIAALRRARTRGLNFAHVDLDASHENLLSILGYRVKLGLTFTRFGQSKWSITGIELPVPDDSPRR